MSEVELWCCSWACFYITQIVHWVLLKPHDKYGLFKKKQRLMCIFILPLGPGKLSKCTELSRDLLVRSSLPFGTDYTQIANAKWRQRHAGGEKEREMGLSNKYIKYSRGVCWIMDVTLGSSLLEQIHPMMATNWRVFTPIPYPSLWCDIFSFGKCVEFLCRRIVSILVPARKRHHHTSH